MVPKTKAVLQPCQTQKPPFSIQVPGVEKKPGEGIPRTHLKGPKPYLEEDCRTIYDIVLQGMKKYSEGKCMGSRKLIKVHEETKMVKKVVDGDEIEVPKQWSYFEMSGYTYLTFKEYSELIHDVGCGLRNLGLTKGDRIQVYAATR